MGEKGAVSPGERSPPRQVGREGDRAAEQPTVLSRPGLSSGGCSAAGGHQLGLRHLRRQAGARGSADTQQDVLLLLAHHQGAGE